MAQPNQRRLAAAVAFVLGAALVAPGAAAEGVPPSVELLAGTCDGPGEAVATLSDAPDGSPAQESTLPALAAVIEALDGSVVERATIVLPLRDIAVGDRVIAVRDSSDAAATGLACGELGAFEPQGTDIQVGLAEQDDSGRNGVAWLHDNGDGTTSLSVVLSSPAEAEPAEAHVEVAIVGSIYGPNPLEIAPGTTVTWRNEDTTPHTTTDVDFGFDSGYMAQGDTWTRTFETPGTYPYFCVYHPRMRGTVIVD